MGRGNRFMQEKFSVPMAGAHATWPPERAREYCPGCDRPESFCDCDPKPASRSQARRFAAQKAEIAAHKREMR